MSESCPSSSFASPERPRRKAKAVNTTSEITDDCAALKRTSRIAARARKQAPNLANGTQHIITLNDSGNYCLMSGIRCSESVMYS